MQPGPALDHDGLFDKVPEVMSLLGTDLGVRSQNLLSRQRYGDGGGRPCYEVHFGRDSRCPGCNVDSVLTGGTTGRWFLTDQRGDKPDYFEVTMAPVLDRDGKVEGLIEVIRDATVSFAVEQHLIRTSEELEGEVERRTKELDRIGRQTDELRENLAALRRDQAAVVQTEKMASVGRLAAGLTHEMHTPLGALVSNADMLRRTVQRMKEQLEGAGEEAAPLRKQVETSAELLELQRLASERLRKIVGSLRMFAHLDRAEEEAYDLHEGIDAALALLRHQITGRIEIDIDYGELPPVYCRPDAINQVFMNLLENAVAAIEEQGTIRIATRVDGDDVVLEFADSGKGIPAEALSRVFEPGFTTKPRGVGTGLGLAIALRTMSDHGGTIEIESEPGQGTRFTLRMPVRPSDAE